MKIIGTVIGRISRPASIGGVAEHVLQVLRLEEHHRPVGADQREGGGAGAEVGAVAEQREVDDRLADPALDDGEARAGPEPRRGRRRAPGGAPGIGLDQGQDDREEADADQRPDPLQSILVPEPGSGTPAPPAP